MLSVAPWENPLHGEILSLTNIGSSRIYSLLYSLNITFIPQSEKEIKENIPWQGTNTLIIK